MQAWGIDPLLGELFPSLWNALISTATPNDTWVAQPGVSGTGYVYMRSLDAHPEVAAAYQRRSGQAFARLVRQPVLNNWAPFLMAIDHLPRQALDTLSKTL
jgi:hypothetical protein